MEDSANPSFYSLSMALVTNFGLMQKDCINKLKIFLQTPIAKRNLINLK